ncbi:glycosyltransferase family 4 protein [Roseivivax sp. CAU 1761]
MRILIVVSEFPKLTETFAYRNALEFRRLGHDVRIFHIKRFRRAEIVHDFMRPLIDRAFTYGYLSRAALAALAAEAVTAPRPLARTLRHILRAYRHEPKRGLAVLSYLPKALALGRFCRRAGIEHIHAEFAGHPATAAMIAARVAGTPFSFSAHAHDIFISQALLAEKARDAAFVRAISRFNMAFLAELPDFPAGKLRLVRCGVQRAAVTEGPPPPRGPGPLRILYVGALLERKGVRHLIDALAALPPGLDWRARIVGGGALGRDLAARARALGLGDRLRFDGPQPAEATAQAFRDAHVVVVPSIVGAEGRMEGIPVVVMEAMAHAVPVIASALSGIPELVEDGVTGRLVPPGDAGAIARALQDIDADWPAAAAMGARGRARVAVEYVVEDNARDLARLMEAAA